MQARSQVLSFGVQIYFYVFLKKILGTTQFGGNKKYLGGIP